MNKKIGYTTGIFDLFHIGHLNVLKKAKNNCDYLIVGVSNDNLARILKGKTPVIPFEERIEIVKSIRCVDEVVEECDSDKLKACDRLGFNIIFKGSDWQGTSKWNELELEFNKRGVEVMFFPYTETTSSTLLRSFLNGEGD